MSFREPVTGGAGVQEGGGERLSLGVAARLSRYLQVLTQAKKMGRETISSQELADTRTQIAIRRDLPLRKFGSAVVGTTRLARLADPQDPAHHGQAQHRALRAGKLGQAIAGSDIFRPGFRVVALFDKDRQSVRRSTEPDVRHTTT